MLLKSFVRAQKQIASRRPRGIGLGRSRNVEGTERESHLASLQFDELMCLASACLAGSDHARTSVHYGVVVEEIAAFRKTLGAHVGGDVADATKALRRLESLKLVERKACRKLLNAIAGSIHPMREDKKADFRMFLGAVEGLDSPGSWTWEQRAAVLRILGRARAGAGRVHGRPIAGKVGSVAVHEITWEPTIEGADINPFWVTVITLALLRARALLVLEHQRQPAENRRPVPAQSSGATANVNGPGQ